MNEEERALRESWLALRGNAFWQQLYHEILLRRDYLRKRLTEAERWEDCCRLQGGLEQLERILYSTEAMERGDEE